MEQEVFGKLTKEEYEKFKVDFTSKYGVPEIVKRLTFAFKNPAIKGQETMLRITNGDIELIQKTGHRNGKVRVAKELAIDLKVNAEEFFNVYEILKNINGSEHKIKIKVFDNLLWYTDDAEIKLSFMTGKSVKHCFEVELLNDAKDLEEVTDAIGLGQFVEETDGAYWAEWDKDLLYYHTDKTDDEIKAMIAEALA